MQPNLPSLRIRQEQEALALMGSCAIEFRFENTLHFCVHWLSRESALPRFWNLRELVLKYLEENSVMCLGSACYSRRKTSYGIHLAFLADIMGHLRRRVRFN
ncbi:hypothetical protein TNCV_905771 [Trichonephila clavipes]|nr:hypothetical protein TNCV_905771 [Trichonephila clavipes]